jgi:hypothetical protein
VAPSIPSRLKSPDISDDSSSEDDPAVVNLQSRESVDWLRAASDEDEDNDTEADTDGQE